MTEYGAASATNAAATLDAREGKGKGMDDLLPRRGRDRWLLGADAALLAVLVGGVLTRDRLPASLVPPVWLLLPGGLLLGLVGCQTLLAHRRIGAGIDAYNAEYQAHRQSLDGTMQAVVGGVVLAGLGATLAIVGLFFGIFGVVLAVR